MEIPCLDPAFVVELSADAFCGSSLSVVERAK